MNVFSLFAKLSLDTKEYESGLSDAKSKAGSFVSGVKSVVGKAGDLLATVGKTAAAAIGVASTAVSGLAKKSLDAYADFEQLEGGAKLMFGDAYDFIMQKSAEAYSTVQLSQNAYLEQVNGFAVGLKTALGGNELAAAELADRIVTAEADIVSATGNSQEAVQNAFNGIMKSNYTMLDNLQLGIKPTKEGMQEVIDKVNAWNKANGKATSYVIDNLADVQSALVDYVEMQGLAGYASNEASTTIQGSIAGMKAAWQNFLTGTGSPAQLVKTMKTAAGNVVKQIKVIVPQLVTGLKGLAHELVPEIPGIMNDLLPTVIDGAVGLLTAVTEELPAMTSTLLPPLIRGIVMIMSAVIKNLPGILKSFANAIPQVLTTLIQSSGEMLKAGKEILGMLVNGLISASQFIGENFPEAVSGILGFLTDSNAIGQIFDVASVVIGNLAQGLINCLNDENVGKSAGEIIEQLGNKLADAAKSIGSHVGDILDAFGNFLQNSEGIKKLVEAAGKILKGIADGITDPENLNKIIEAAPKIIKALMDGVEEAVEQINDIGKTIVNSLADYLFFDRDAEDHWKNLIDGAGKILGYILKGMQKVSELATEPYKWLAEFILKKLGLYDWYEKGRSAIESFKNGVINGIKEFFGDIANAGNKLGDKLYDALHPGSSDERVAANNTLVDYERAGLTEEDYEKDSNANAYYKYLYQKNLTPGKEINPEDFGLDKSYVWAKEHRIQGVPVFGKGGIVTKPTLALIGEDGAEAVVPLEKDSEVGRRFGGMTIEKIEVNVNANGIEDINEVGNIIVQQIDAALRRYQVQQVRGQGGTAW